MKQISMSPTLKIELQQYLSRLEFIAFGEGISSFDQKISHLIDCVRALLEADVHVK